LNDVKELDEWYKHKQLSRGNADIIGIDLNKQIKDPKTLQLIEERLKNNSLIHSYEVERVDDALDINVKLINNKKCRIVVTKDNIEVIGLTKTQTKTVTSVIIKELKSQQNDKELLYKEII